MKTPHPLLHCWLPVSCVQVCNHRFHGECIKHWGDTSCPVCRYCMLSSNANTSRCSTCGANTNLWICLICGHVGCGRWAQDRVVGPVTCQQHYLPHASRLMRLGRGWQLHHPFLSSSKGSVCVSLGL